MRRVLEQRKNVLPLFRVGRGLYVQSALASATSVISLRLFCILVYPTVPNNAC